MHRLPTKEKPSHLRVMHKLFLSSNQSLERQATMSLEERCAEFMRQFPGKTLTVYK